MPKIQTRVTFDKKAAVMRIKAANDFALTMVGNHALKDSSIHVPEDQELLRDSGLARGSRQAENGRFELRWSVPYAQYLWHGLVMIGTPTSRDYDEDRPIKFTKDLARAEWAKYAKETYGEQWKAVYQKALKEGLR